MTEDMNKLKEEMVKRALAHPERVRKLKTITTNPCTGLRENDLVMDVEIEFFGKGDYYT